MTASAPAIRWEELARLIARRTGLAGFTVSRENLERAAERARVQGLTQVGPELEQDLAEGLARWDTLIDELTVRETYFFRHADQFEIVRERVVPELRKLLQERAWLRVWSAGCASGEEAYSLAMLFSDEGLLDRVQLIGTDISRAAVERGRAARYHDWSFRTLEPWLAERHFRREGRARVVSDVLRRQVQFRQLNLAHSTYPALGTELCDFSLIFCRNVLMFLDADTIAAIAGRLFASLLPGGWLFTGPSDPNLAQYVEFDVHVTPAGLVYQRPLRERSSLHPPRLSVLPPTAATTDVWPFVPVAAASSSLHDSHSPPACELVPAAAPERARGVRDAWNSRGAQVALGVCLEALACCATDERLELHHLEALVLWELQRLEEAATAMRRVLYLDRSNAIAHFGLGSLLERLGERRSAQRSYVNALSCCDKVAPELALPLGDGICASGLRGAAQRGLSRLNDAGGADGAKGGGT